MDKPIVISPHAEKRIQARGTCDAEVIQTIQHGERVPAKFGRVMFRRNFPFNAGWMGKSYRCKQLEVYAKQTESATVVVTVIVKFF